MSAAIEEQIPAIAEETVSLADFLGEAAPPAEPTKVLAKEPSETPVSQEPPPEVAPSVEQKSTKVPQLEPEPESEEAPLDLKTPPVVKPGEIDLNDIPEADRPLLRKMARDAAQRFAAMHRENKKAQEEYAAKEAKLREEIKSSQEGKIPQSYYEHPDAYVHTW